MHPCTSLLFLVAGLVSGIAHAAAPTAAERFARLSEREWAWRQEQFAGADDEDSQGQPAAQAGELTNSAALPAPCRALRVFADGFEDNDG